MGIRLAQVTTSIAFHENLYTVIARSEATKQSQQGSQTTPRDCFANARNDNFLMKRYTSRHFREADTHDNT